MTAAEEREMLEELPVRDQCCEDDELETMVSYLYRSSLKKYSRPDDSEEVPELPPGGAGVSPRAVANCPEVMRHQAEVHFYNCDYEQCYKITTRFSAKQSLKRVRF